MGSFLLVIALYAVFVSIYLMIATLSGNNPFVQNKPTREVDWTRAAHDSGRVSKSEFKRRLRTGYYDKPIQKDKTEEDK